MRPSTTAIAATAAAAASMVLLAGCGGDGPEGAPPPPATTKAAPARNAAADIPRKILFESPQQREAFQRAIIQCVTACANPRGIAPGVPYGCIEGVFLRMGIDAL